jgi:hypothetical protein
VIAEIEETEIEVNGQSYWVQWSFPLNFTFCAIIKVKGGRTSGAFGSTVCNPKDSYERKIGMKWAARRACGIDLIYGNYAFGADRHAIYGQLRKFIKERHP